MNEGFKKTVIGEVPQDWKVISIGETGKIINGGTPSTTEPAYWNGETPWCTPTDITALKGKKYISKTARSISDEGVKESSATIIGPNSLIVCTRATLGYSAINVVPFTTNQGFKSIVPYQNIEVEFLFYTISSIRSTIERLASGSTFLEISKKAFEAIKIAVPPLQEQQKIAKILSTVDEKIEVIGEQISQTRELKRGLMQRLLTKGIGHTRFKDSPLGKIPESWEVKELRKVASFRNGKAHEKNVAEDGNYILVNSKFISSNGQVQKTTDSNLCPLFAGEITMVMSDVPNGKAIAKCFLVDEDEKYTLNQRICALKSLKANTKYLFYIINRNRFYLGFDNGVGQTNLKKDEVLQCPIPYPPLAEQQKIGRILSTVDEKLEVLQDKKQQYQELKKGLMQQLLTGKIRVGIDEPLTA
ncbi:restriction endonuclease subunit S [Nafulsella turpanensis]|uniref:restriction endonuclease subunit S n=1 Tax=Nafulsella turpanensis TaxID=1265690 RepID=UPI000376663E|nr:restriction endonuclease subunit S [Nafulsella turpanensis]